MEAITLGLSGLIVALALASMLVLLWRPNKTPAELLFAIFCGSLAMALLRPGLMPAPGWVQFALALGSCATCNVYWLVARALFRGQGGVQRVHVGAAALIAALIVGHRVLQATLPGSPVLAALASLLSLTSSAVLVLAFAEAMRGFDAAARAEQRLRLAFMAVYGSCVLAGTLIGALVETRPDLQGVQQLVVLCCALAILTFTHVALELRRRRARDTERGTQPQPEALSACVDPGDDRLAVALTQAFEVERLYREPELKVADLARHVGSAPHRVSRVINQVLGARNFNHWVNSYRIEQACRLLRSHPRRSVLDVSLEAGFASLGPFNRAFKAAMGCTPTEWRALPDTDAAVPPKRAPHAAPSRSTG